VKGSNVIDRAVNDIGSCIIYAFATPHFAQSCRYSAMVVMVIMIATVLCFTCSNWEAHGAEFYGIGEFY